MQKVLKAPLHGAGVVFQTAVLRRRAGGDLVPAGFHVREHLVKAVQAPQPRHDLVGVGLLEAVQNAEIFAHIKFFEIHVCFSFQQLVQQTQQAV